MFSYGYLTDFDYLVSQVCKKASKEIHPLYSGYENIWIKITEGWL